MIDKNQSKAWQVAIHRCGSMPQVLGGFSGKRTAVAAAKKAFMESGVLFTIAWVDARMVPSDEPGVQRMIRSDSVEFGDWESAEDNLDNIGAWDGGAR